MQPAENDRIFDYFYVARQAIFSKTGDIWGYELLFRDGSDKQTAEMTNQEMATLCVATCGFIQSQKYARQSRKICINFTEKLILEGVPRALPPSISVIEIVKDINATRAVIEALTELKQEGYMIAINSYMGTEHQNRLLKMADIIKIDIQGKTPQEIQNLFSGIAQMDVLKVAEKVENREMLQMLRSLSVDLYQGYFFAKPVNLRGRSLNAAEISKLRVIQAIQDPCLSTETIKNIIVTDPGVTYRLLRFLNSAAFGFSVKIESIKHAIDLLGLQRLKYWLRMLIMSDFCGKNKTPELYVMSLYRGRFLEEITMRGQIKEATADTMFLFGMLSLLEPMLDLSIQKILDDLPLSDEIKAGYLDSNSNYGKYLLLINAVEKGNPDKLECICRKLGVCKKEVAAASSRVLAWVDSIYQYMA